MAFLIRRPIFTCSAFLLLLFAGLFAFEKLEIREYPDISGDTIMVMTSDPGASAETIETLVTTPIENALQGIDGVDYITSTSAASTSRIVINLTVGADQTSAITDIESALSSVKSQLPNGVNDPVIRKADASSMPDMVLSYTSEALSPGAVSDYIMRVVEPSISNLQGVGEVQIMGDREYAMRIWLDADKMQRFGVTAVDVSNALASQNVQATAGEIDRKNQVVTIQAATDNHSAQNFAELVVKKTTHKLIYLKDIARIQLGAKDTTSSMFTNGKPAVGLSITYKNGANPLTTEKRIKNALKNISLPKDLNVSIMRDSADYVKASLTDVFKTLTISIMAVLAVIVLFLGSLRLSLVPLVTIPLSLGINFVLMYLLGFSINLLTLLAFVLAIGLVVDDAIVVMENIHRHAMMGKSTIASAIAGSKEIMLAIIGITLTLLAVFAPIGFNSGITGALFKEFAFTLAGAVLVSGLIALFFTPMMCAYVLKHQRPTALSLKIEAFLDVLVARYRRFLQTIIDLKKVMVLFVVLIFVAGGVSLFLLSQKSELAPSEDQGVIIGMAMGPTSAALHYTESYTQAIYPLIKNNPAVDSLSVVNGFPMGQYSSLVMMKLKDWDQRATSANDIIQNLMPKISQIAGLNIMLSSPPSLPISKGIDNFQFVIKTTGSYQELNQVIQKITAAAKHNANIINTQVDLHIDQPEVTVEIDKAKAGQLGVSMADIAKTLSVAFGEPQSNTFTNNGYAYYVIPEMEDTDRANQSVIDRLQVTTSAGRYIPLSTFVHLKDTISSSTWNHFEGQRSATISAQLAKGYSTEEALSYFKSLAEKYMAKDMNEDTSGQTRSFLQTQGGMFWLFIGALVVIFLVLAAQYESLLDPVVIMFTVPLALTSALLALYFSGNSLNIYTEIGLVCLIGLITKHGILLIDFARQFAQKHQASMSKAIIEAATVRFKPVLMTTAAMVLGSVPLVTASGAGADARNQLGLVIISGMAFGTFFTLVILPTMYTLVHAKKLRLKKRQSRSNLKFTKKS